MNSSISIRPSKDLRSNYSKISELTRQNPVAITVNGREDTVVVSHEYYMDQQKYISELEARLTVYHHLAQSTDDLKLGRVQSLDEAFEEILCEIEGQEL